MNKTKIKSLLNILKKDFLYLLISYFIAIIIFKIGFYKESLFLLARVLFSFYWLFIIPGIFITYTFSKEMKFIERFFIGFGIGAAIIGLSSYYIGLLGLHIKYHGVLLPFVVLVTAVFIIWKKIKSD